jgi:hypothetical protein
MKKHIHSLPLNMLHQLQHESRDAESKNGELFVLAIDIVIVWNQVWTPLRLT